MRCMRDDRNGGVSLLFQLHAAVDHVARPLRLAVGGSLWSDGSVLSNPYGGTEYEADPLHVDSLCATAAAVETAIIVACPLYIKSSRLASRQSLGASLSIFKRQKPSASIPAVVFGYNPSF